MNVRTADVGWSHILRTGQMSSPVTKDKTQTEGLCVCSNKAETCIKKSNLWLAELLQVYHRDRVELVTYSRRR